jgi:hypothetical protein
MFILCLIVGIYLTGFIAMAKNLTYNNYCLLISKCKPLKQIKLCTFINPSPQKTVYPHRTPHFQYLLSPPNSGK